jgi:hypothetical protein
MLINYDGKGWRSLLSGPITLSDGGGVGGMILSMLDVWWMFKTNFPSCFILATFSLRIFVLFLTFDAPQAFNVQAQSSFKLIVIEPEHRSFALVSECCLRTALIIRGFSQQKMDLLHIIIINNGVLFTVLDAGETVPLEIFVLYYLLINSGEVSVVKVFY